MLLSAAGPVSPRSSAVPQICGNAAVRKAQIPLQSPKFVGMGVGRVVCPRCGELGYLEKYIVAGRAYLRVVHGRGKNRRRCYVGPAEGYEHAEVHLALGLTNRMDVRYDEVAVSALDHFLIEAMLARTKSEAELAEALERARRLRSLLEERLGELQRLEEALERELRLRREE